MKKIILLSVFLMAAVSNAWAETPVDTFAAKPKPSPIAAAAVNENLPGVCQTLCGQKNTDATKLCRSAYANTLPECLKDAMEKFDACVQTCR